MDTGTYTSLSRAAAALQVNDLVIVTAEECLLVGVVGTIAAVEGSLGRLHVKVLLLYEITQSLYFRVLGTFRSVFVVTRTSAEMPTTGFLWTGADCSLSNETI